MSITLEVPDPAEVAFVHSLTRSRVAGSFQGTRLIIKVDGAAAGVGLISSHDANANLLVVRADASHDLEETGLALLAERALSRSKTSTVTLHHTPARPDDTDTAAHPLYQREWALTQSLIVEDFGNADSPSIAALCRAEGWRTYADPDVAAQGCAAPGVTTLVVRNTLTGTVAGFAQVLSDGIAQGYLAQLIVHAAYRRIGLARTLVEKVYARSGAKRLDLLTDDAQAFYDSFTGEAKPGYRIYPGS